MILFVISYISYTDDGIGDICEDDYDMDHVPNYLDNCPNNSKIFSTDFRTYQTIALDPIGDSQIDPKWYVHVQLPSNICQSQAEDNIFPFLIAYLG